MRVEEGGGERASAISDAQNNNNKKKKKKWDKSGFSCLLPTLPETVKRSCKTQEKVPEFLGGKEESQNLKKKKKSHGASGEMYMTAGRHFTS